MKCPLCGCETEKGAVKAAGSSPFAARVEYFPEEEEKKIFKSRVIQLKGQAEGWRCPNCQRVFACFEER